MLLRSVTIKIKLLPGKKVFKFSLKYITVILLTFFAAVT